MAGKYVFMVFYFNKNKRLLMALMALLGIVLAVWLIVSFTNFLIQTFGTETELPYNVIYQDPDWRGDTQVQGLPRFFVAGGISYDEEILVEGWGLSREAVVPVDYFNDLGVHVLHGSVTRVTYNGSRLNIYVDSQDTGYQMITISKQHLSEGDLQVAFLDTNGVPLAYEEEYIYSVPINCIVIHQEQQATKTVYMEYVDSVDVLAGMGFNPAKLAEYLTPEYIVLHVHGGRVTVAQRQDSTVRLYFTSDDTSQVLAIRRDQLKSADTTLRLIDSSDLGVKEQIVIPWHSN